MGPSKLLLPPLPAAWAWRALEQAELAGGSLAGATAADCWEQAIP